MDTTTHVSRHHGVLGTVIEIQIATPDAATADGIVRSILGTITRLEGVFSRFDPTSELNRWKRGEAEPGPELTALLDLARRWQTASGGAFSPHVGALMEAWDRAERTGVAPAAEELRGIVDRVARPAGAVDPSLDLNAIAKGWIVDRAISAIDESSFEDLVVNAGGDLVHRGRTGVTAGIENPLRPYDNEPPLQVAPISNGALATSGTSRRGWRIGAVRYGHVVDPRTGWPAGHIASASVIAADAASADALATILTVLHPADGLELVDGFDGASALVVAADGTVHSSHAWPGIPISR